MQNLLRISPLVLSLIVGASGLRSADAPAAPSVAKGVVIFADEGSAADEFAIAKEFVAVDSFGMTSTFTFADGKTMQVQPTKMRKIFMYPDFSSMTLLTENDWKSIQDQADQATALMKKYPRSAPILKAFVERLNNAIARSKQGLLWIAGKWMTPQEYEQQNASVKNAYVASLVIDGKVYKNVKASALQEDQLRIMHDGGFSTIALKKLSDAQRQDLAKTNTDLARMLAPGSAGAAPVTKTRFPFSIVGDTVTVQLPDGPKSYALDQVPGSLISNDSELETEIKRHRAERAKKK